jgi:hypothetical protein
MNDKELLWKQYELNINTYRGYLELALKINIFHYAITGAILTYYFAHHDQPLIRLALVFPLAMSVWFTVLFGVGAYLSKNTRRETRELGTQLGFRIIPELHILTLFLAIFAALMLLVAVGLILLILLN